jgi:hypothetical protein
MMEEITDQAHENLERISYQFLGRLYKHHGHVKTVFETGQVVPLPTCPDAPDLVPTIRDIINTVATYYGLSVADLSAQSRADHLVRARHVACYLAHKLTGKPYAQIGRMLGNRDHSTIRYAVEKITADLPALARLADDIDIIKLHLRQSLLTRKAAA